MQTKVYPVLIKLQLKKFYKNLLSFQANEKRQNEGEVKKKNTNAQFIDVSLSLLSTSQATNKRYDDIMEIQGFNLNCTSFMYLLYVCLS